MANLRWAYRRHFSNAVKNLVLVRNHVPPRDTTYHYYYQILRNGVQYNVCTQNGRIQLLRREGVSYIVRLQHLALCLLQKCDPVLKKVFHGEDYKILVVCGPSGSGKSTLIERLFKEYPSKFGFSVSHTTRKPRPGEVHGEHYFFTTPAQMKAAIDRGEFLETASFSGNTYGTSFNSVRQVCNSGKVCILDIEMEGVKQVKQTDLKPILIFIKPPSMPELEKRLRARGTETEDSLNRRLTRAKVEMDYGEIEGNFHKIIVNDNLEESYKIFNTYVKDELSRRNIQLDETNRDEISN